MIKYEIEKKNIKIKIKIIKTKFYIKYNWHPTMIFLTK
jgi:hypothetical protein